jgi:hypothetical protein
MERFLEAYFSSENNTTRVREARHVRCHWRGSPTWNFHATIDIVTLDAFTEFCTTRADEVSKLLQRLIRAHAQVVQCFKNASLDPLEVKGGARGVTGTPGLLREALTPARKVARTRKQSRTES